MAAACSDHLIWKYRHHRIGSDRQLSLFVKKQQSSAAAASSCPHRPENKRVYDSKDSKIRIIRAK
jgi:hypothetical protein